MPDSEQTGAGETRQQGPKLRHEPPDVPGYRLEQREAIPVSRLNWLTFPLAIPFGAVFYLIGTLIQDMSQVVLSFSLLTLPLLLVIVVIGVPLVHEAVHGLVAAVLGAKPFYGIGQGFAYTSFKEPVTPRQYALISAAPLVILSLLAVAAFTIDPGWFLYIVVFATTNAAGAVGDLWILNRIRSLPSDAFIYDLADGFAAFIPEERSGKR